MYMKRVLLVSIDGLGNGGVQSVMMSIVRSLSNKCRFDIIVFHKGPNHNYYEEEFKHYGNIFFINRDRSKCLLIRLFRYLIRPFYEYAMYKRIIKNGGYDVVHCHNEEESTLALKAAKKCNVKIRLTHSHNAFDRDKQKGILAKYRSFLRKRINKYSTLNIACSEMAGTSLFGSHPFTVIYNPIELKKFKPSRFNGDETKMNIINVGRFCDQKNQIFLLRIFIEILKIVDNSALTLIGYGPSESVLKQFVSDNNIKNVTFLPPDTSVSEELKKNDIFILPSLYEGFPLSLIEAQVSGLKCFVSNSVTKEANLGFAVYLDLSSSESQWASEITKFWMANHHNRFFVGNGKIDNFSPEFFADVINRLYEGLAK